MRRDGADTAGAQAFINKVTSARGRPRAQELGLRAAAAGLTLRAGFTALLALCLGIVLAFLTVPILALFTEVPLRDVPGLLRDPAVRDTLAVTLRTNAIANVADPRASARRPRTCSARAASPAAALLITLIELPLVLPPAVAGIGLLAAFGAGGLFGDELAERRDHPAVHGVGGRAGRHRSSPRRSTCARRSRRSRASTRR